MTKSRSFAAATLGLAVAAFVTGAASAQSVDRSQVTSDAGLSAYRYSQSFSPNHSNDGRWSHHQRASQRDQRYIGRYDR